MNIDVIILSYAKDESYENMNRDCMKSICDSTDSHEFHFYLVETNSEKEFSYPDIKNCSIIQPNEEFNYNRFLNIALKHCKNEWVLITNNDTIYHTHFIEHMLNAHNYDPQILSMSAMDDEWHCHKTFPKEIQIWYGYRTSYEVAGWSIFVKREVLDQINGFDENFKFICQDNDYALTIQTHGIKHALITNAKVTHLLSKSWQLITDEKLPSMNDEMHVQLRNKWYS